LVGWFNGPPLVVGLDHRNQVVWVLLGGEEADLAAEGAQQHRQGEAAFEASRGTGGKHGGGVARGAVVAGDSGSMGEESVKGAGEVGNALFEEAVAGQVTRKRSERGKITVEDGLGFAAPPLGGGAQPCPSRARRAEEQLVGELADESAGFLVEGVIEPGWVVLEQAAGVAPVVAVEGEEVDGDLAVFSPVGGGDSQQPARPAIQLGLLGELPGVCSQPDTQVAGRALQKELQMSIFGVDLVDLER
jgi:hypothetical protein